MPSIRHHHVEIDGLKVFVRGPGDTDRPTLVLLPGYPSSTRSYIRLIDRLSPNWHTAAIDYPGFGSSDPLPGSPTFHRLAEITGKVIDELGIGDYVIYMFDVGGPICFRIALAHDCRVRGIISQNGNISTDGFGPGVAALTDWWADRNAGQPAVDGFVSLVGTQMQWLAGARDPSSSIPSRPSPINSCSTGLDARTI